MKSSFSVENPRHPRRSEGGGDISAVYQSWKTAQMEEEDRELLEHIQRMVMSEKPMSMFVQLHTSNILLWGVEKVKSELVTSWQNQGAVAGFVGAIGFSILLNALDKSVGFDEDDTTHLTQTTRAYYILWGLATMCEIVCLLLLLVVSLHVTFALTEANFLDFIVSWEHVIRLPEVLTTVGCYAMVIGSCVGVFIITDKVTGWVVSVIGIGLSSVATMLWLSMIRKNVKMGEDAAKKLMASFKEHLKNSN